MNSLKYKCAWISYLNLLPVKIELEKRCKLDFIPGHPAFVNSLLAECNVDFGPTSSIAFLRNNPTRENFIPYGIGCSGPVQSVFFGFKNADKIYRWMIDEKNKLKLFLEYNAEEKIFSFPGSNPPHKFSVQFSEASETSVTLAKIFLRLFSGDTRSFGDPDAENVIVLIGDEALRRRAEFDYIIDLGDLWFDVTQLPFVFALWHIHGKNSLPQLISESADAVIENLPSNFAQYLPDVPIKDSSGEKIDLEKYWKCLDYKLTPDHLRGMELFFKLSKHMCKT